MAPPWPAGSPLYHAGRSRALLSEREHIPVEPEYIAFQGDISLRAVWDLLRLTNAA
jgi:hypothetical protein